MSSKWFTGSWQSTGGTTTTKQKIMKQELFEQFDKLNSTAQEALVNFLKAVNEGTTGAETPEQKKARAEYEKTMRDWHKGTRPTVFRG